MHILLDVEWLIHSPTNQSVTQLAALRVDEHRNDTDEFSALLCPVSFSCVSGSEIFLNDYDRRAFANAPDWAACAESFAAWLQPDDILFVWHSFSAELPDARLILKHLKDMDGHFVTQREFHRHRR